MRTANQEIVQKLISLINRSPGLLLLRDKTYQRAFTTNDTVAACYRVNGRRSGDTSLRAAFNQLLHTTKEQYIKQNSNAEDIKEVAALAYWTETGAAFCQSFVDQFEQWLKDNKKRKTLQFSLS